MYDGKNLCVRRMMRKLQALQESLYGAYLHGSLASMDDIRYSDFDALVIVKEEVCADPERLARTAYALNGLRKIMFAYDPLQHHGWFVLTTADLRCYCDAYFPLELFRHARSLLPGTGTVVSARPRDSRREYEETLNRALNNIERKLANSGFPKDAFALKSLLSEIMLLPALFIQATRGQAIYKADSFQAAARYFEPSIWQAMDRVSAIRAAWQYQLGGLRRALLTGPVAPRKLITRWCSPPVAPQIRKQLDRQLADLLLRLVSEMRAAARG